MPDERPIRDIQTVDSVRRVGGTGILGSVARWIDRLIPISRLFQPGPEAIRVVAIRRGADVYFDALNAGGQQWWSLPTLDAPADGLVTVTSNIDVQNDGPLGGGGTDTYAHLETYVDGGMIGKAIQKVGLGDTEMVTALAMIRVAEGTRSIRIRMTTSGADLVLGDISSVGLFVPDSLAKVSVVHF